MQPFNVIHGYLQINAPAQWCIEWADDPGIIVVLVVGNLLQHERRLSQANRDEPLLYTLEQNLEAQQVAIKAKAGGQVVNQ